MPAGSRYLKRGLALLVAVLALVPFGISGARAAVPNDFFGVDAGQSLESGHANENTTSMAVGGLQVVRSVATTQLPGDSGYDWSIPDLEATEVASDGLRWYPVIAYAPPYPSHPDVTDAPLHDSDYANFAAALAARYGPGGSFWDEHSWLHYVPVTTYEIWNEENSYTYWSSQANAPERYADLYMATRAAIKAVQPGATVVVGGLALGTPGKSTDEIEFLQRMFAHRPDLRGNVDAVGLHPYQSTVANVYMRIAKVRQALDALAGPQVPIEVTEVGWSSSTTSEASRGADLAQLAIELPRSDCNVTRLIPFEWSSNGVAADSDFAIASGMGEPFQSGQSYLDAVQTMRGLSSTPAPTGTVPVCADALAALANASNRPARRAVPPRLTVRMRRDRRHSRVRVSAQCTSGCKLRAELLVVRARSRRLRRLTVRSFGLSGRTRRFTVHIPRGVTKVKLHVVAIGKTGLQTSRVRSLRIR